jgi:stage III sporulation protein AA
MPPLQEILKILPINLAREIASRSHGRGTPREIRLRRRGSSQLVFASGSVPLSAVNDDTVDAAFSAVCRGAPYAYRDSIVQGFVPLSSGVRVGVAGRAHYDGGRLVGVSDVASLVFRIPTGGCDFRARIVEICRSASGGVLIFSPPMGGKTTALRAIAAELSRDRRVAIVDEREEIACEDLAGRNIDILLGYRRATGIEIATRCLAPEVIITDEIAAEDADDILAAANSGVPIIATAHAATACELLAKEHISRLIRGGAFVTLVGIYREGGRFVCREERVD